MHKSLVRIREVIILAKDLLPSVLKPFITSKDNEINAFNKLIIEKYISTVLFVGGGLVWMVVGPYLKQKCITPTLLLTNTGL
jgi:hypothetical protein